MNKIRSWDVGGVKLPEETEELRKTCPITTLSTANTTYIMPEIEHGYSW
jgi:hypothetical protein